MTQLQRANMHPDPYVQFKRWFEEARATGMDLPESVVLATVDGQGRPSLRMVLMRGHDSRGFVFFSNYESAKGRQIESNPAGALLFYWPDLRRQIRIPGILHKISSVESDRYFRTRPRGHQLSAWSSPQSQVIEDRLWLEERYALMEKKFQQQDIPRPPHWGGYRLAPNAFEFWEHRADRFHDRLRYRRDEEGGWALDRLAP